MGNSESTQASAPAAADKIEYFDATPLFAKFTGEERLLFADKFWVRLLGANFVLQEFSSSELDSVAGHCCNDLATHNPQTGNFVTLVQHLVRLLDGLPSTPTSLHHSALNACFLVRMYGKYFVETLGEKALDAQFQGDGRSGSILPVLVHSLLEALVGITVNEATYAVYTEVIKTLLVLFSTQLYSAASSQRGNKFIDAAMRPSARMGQASPAALMQKLLKNFLAAVEIEASAVDVSAEAARVSAEGAERLSEEGAPTEEEPGIVQSQDGIIFKIGSAASVLVALPLRVFAYFFPTGSDSKHKPSSLSHLSLLLVLSLSLYRPASVHVEVASMAEASPRASNRYRAAVAMLPDIAEKNATDAGNAEAGVEYNQLYDTLTAQLTTHTGLLLLYLLLHTNNDFFNYAIHARTDTVGVVEPLMQVVFETSVQLEGDGTAASKELASSQLSTALSVILILTRDDVLCKNLQSITISSVEWYKEKTLHDISLGSLGVVVLLRAVQMSLNSSKGDGGSSVSSCLATLANMAPNIRHMHPYAAQRLLNLFDTVGRRYQRLCESYWQAQRAPQPEMDLDSIQALEEEMMYFEDLVRMVLEVFSLVITMVACSENPHLIYSLLHRKAVFETFFKEPFKSMPSLWEPLAKIKAVITFFEERLESAQLVSPTFEAIMDTITENAHMFASEQQGAVGKPEKYIYEEQGGPDEFFAPYLWQVVVETSGLAWSLERIQLYQVELCPAEGANASLDTRSVRELKAFIQQAGLSHADCTEITDLRQRAREAAGSPALAQATEESPIVMQRVASNLEVDPLDATFEAGHAAAAKVDEIVSMLPGPDAGSQGAAESAPASPL